MATASSFTKVSVIASMSVDEADALLLFIDKMYEGARPKLSIAQQDMVREIYQAIKDTKHGPSTTR